MNNGSHCSAHENSCHSFNMQQLTPTATGLGRTYNVSLVQPLLGTVDVCAGGEAIWGARTMLEQSVPGVALVVVVAANCRGDPLQRRRVIAGPAPRRSRVSCNPVRPGASMCSTAPPALLSAATHWSRSGGSVEDSRQRQRSRPEERRLRRYLLTRE